MEEKQFKSVTVRTALIKQVQDFIDAHPDFIAENPEFGSVAGFMQQAARSKLRELQKEE